MPRGAKAKACGRPRPLPAPPPSTPRLSSSTHPFAPLPPPKPSNPSQGAGAHLLYIRLLRKFPYISLLSPDLLTSAAALLVSHFLWVRHFFAHTGASLEYVLAFMLGVCWLVPFVLFISLAANESVLPGGQGGTPQTTKTPRSRDSPPLPW